MNETLENQIDNDKKLCLLLEMFPSADIQALQSHLVKFGEVERVVQEMTRKRKNLMEFFTPNQKPRIQAPKPSSDITTDRPSINDLLKWSEDALDKKKNTWAPLIIDVESKNPIVKDMITSTSVTVQSRLLKLHHIALPPKGDVYVSLVLDFLPPELADLLLEDTMKDAKEWRYNHYIVGDKRVLSPHTSAFYSVERNDWEEPGKYQFGGKSIRSPLEMPKSLKEALDMVSCFVSNNPPPIRKLGDYVPHALELPPNKWVANCCVANCYKDETESVGWHSDRLTSIGPFPTISSLTLGATRSFRLRPVGKVNIELPFPSSETNIQSNQAVATNTYVFPLPHNSLLVMHRGCQERYRHDVPAINSKLPSIIPHPKAGKLRFNYTFRAFRKEYVSNVPKCLCGNSCDLRSVNHFKGTGFTFGRYFWTCAGAGEAGESQQNPYWQEGDQPLEPQSSSRRRPGERCNQFLFLEDWLSNLKIT
jgi:hypothetical protein